MTKNYKRKLTLFFIISFLIIYIVNSTSVTNEFLEYTKLFINTLLPSSFIVLLISTLLINLNVIEFLSNLIKKDSTTLYILLISLISGFPTGIKIVTSLYQNNYIEKENAQSFTYFIHFPNPIFMLNMSYILNTNLLNLIISLYLPNIFLALFTYKKTSKTKQNTNYLSFSKALSNSITNTVKTIILIYGTSILFYLSFYLLTKYIKFPFLIYIGLSGLFDLTKGITNIALINNIFIKEHLFLLFLSFGSLSIHMQIKSILQDANLKYLPYIKGRFICMISSQLILILIHNL